MAPLDSSIVNIALPSLSKHFSVGITTVEWVTMAYLLTTSALLLSAGRLGDMKGHKRVYIAGFLIFTAASALCGYAGSITQLILFRALQALGGTCMLANGPAILTSAFPPQERGKALGLIGISVAIGLTIGPFLGGIIISNFGWRWIFFVNIPVGILASILAAIILKDQVQKMERKFDFMGSATAFLTLFMVLLGLSMGNEWGWQSLLIVGLLAGSVILSILFIMVETKVSEPMLDLSLFKIRLFSAANVSALINYLALFVVVFLIPFYLLDVLKQSYRTAGYILTAVPFTTAIVAPLAGTLSDKIGSRLLSSAGLVITALSLFGLSRISPEAGVVPIAILLGTVGMGSGMFQSPNTSAILGAVPRQRLGVASAMQAMMRNIGMVLGIALAGAIVATFAPKGPSDQNITSAIHLAFLVAAGIAAVGVVTSLVRGGSMPQQPNTEGTVLNN